MGAPSLSPRASRAIIPGAAGKIPMADIHVELGDIRTFGQNALEVPEETAL
jgi:hypothetical protein